MQKKVEFFDIDDGEVEGDGDSPEPVLYSRVNTRVQCSKPLLLQLFGSVALLNLSETRNIILMKQNAMNKSLD